MKFQRRLLAATIAALVSPAVYATNGMNMEGYGPIATGMGGASMAYDNGTAAVMNNPATLAMGATGNRLDLAVGELRPDVNAKYKGALPPGVEDSWESGGDSYLMPAVGWSKDTGKYTYGFGMFAQGGMGTEYNSGGPGYEFTANGLGGFSMVGGSDGFSSAVAADLDAEERSEVGVARIIFPFAMQVNDKVNFGASLDYVRATMDVKMIMPGTTFADLLQNNNVSGTMISDPASGLPTLMQNDVIRSVWGAGLSFSDSSDFGGAASGTGWAGKIGVTYQFSPQLTVGATYHSKTSLSDLEGDGDMQMAVEYGANAPAPAPGAFTNADDVVDVSGSVKVKDFEWPTTYAVGMSFQANDKLMVVADVKQIQWSEVMEDFTVEFEADGNQSDQAAAAFGGKDITIAMPQDWDDQTVFQIGLGYQMNNKLVLRAGYNQASNPVPDDTVNYLFPAIVERHFTFGAGYAVSDASAVNASLTYAPEVTVTGSGTSNDNLEVSHAQTNWQLMYSHSF